MIQVFVEDSSNITLAYDVSLDSPTRTLKAAIEEGEGIPVAQQYLRFQGQELDDTKIFSSYNISDGSVVWLGRKPIQVYMKTLTSETIICDADFNEPIHFLKMAVMEKARIPVDRQRLIYKGKVLEDHQTPNYYKIQNEATIHLVLRLRGGGPTDLAYAVACCPWDGDMKHPSINGLKLSHRGMIVVITEKRDKNWYSARELDGSGSGVVPCHFVHIIKYLNERFRQLDLNLNPEPESFPFISSTDLDMVSGIKDILNNPPQDLPIIPAGPLPPFRFPWAEPLLFSRAFADSGHSVLEICITYEREAVPDEPTILNVTLKCHAFGDRVSEVSVQVTVPNGEVLDVQSPPPTMVPGREGEMQVKLSTRNEQKSGVQVDAGLGVPRALTVSHSETSMTGEERSGVVPSTQMSINGYSLRGDTASWWVKEGVTVMGGTGLPAKMSDMLFTLRRQPEAFEFNCLVRVGKGKKYYLKSSQDPESPCEILEIVHKRPCALLNPFQELGFYRQRNHAISIEEDLDPVALIPNYVDKKEVKVSKCRWHLTTVVARRLQV